MSATPDSDRQNKVSMSADTTAVERLTQLYMSLPVDIRLRWAASVGLKDAGYKHINREIRRDSYAAEYSVKPNAVGVAGFCSHGEGVPQPRQHEPGCGPHSLTMIRGEDPDADAFDYERDTADMMKLRDLRKTFDELDTNRNGTLDESEFAHFYTKLDMLGSDLEASEANLARVKSILEQMNPLRDGRVTYDEFCILMLRLEQK
eukprot:PhM_4_TR13363/c0_g2_i1/m.64969